ncbi:hypothetical protein RFI_24021 [Reticulomyxa filosa]|uniref:Uncharacterized protein n=1 Tax=Reticulomyxa filosa TaxID=46433 RepID=X6MH69_RETFI|nr:hypothetical protein RFI_24021 [Reticulomyxa filosa]|eukprot:ETO13353.1 hypothetical protein RFI_24021 [Reticulomyxa filosa]
MHIFNLLYFCIFGNFLRRFCYFGFLFFLFCFLFLSSQHTFLTSFFPNGKKKDLFYASSFSTLAVHYIQTKMSEQIDEVQKGIQITAGFKENSKILSKKRVPTKYVSTTKRMPNIQIIVLNKIVQSVIFDLSKKNLINAEENKTVSKKERKHNDVMSNPTNAKKKKKKLGAFHHIVFHSGTF